MENNIVEDIISDEDLNALNESINTEEENKDLKNNDTKKIKKDKTKEYKEKIKSLEKELADAKNEYFKAYADTDNLKKRLMSEAENTRKYRLQSFALEVLPVIDNFERALLVKDASEEVTTFLKGFEMIYAQLKNSLDQEGVKEIDCLDKDFDPNYHQALMQEVKEGVESGKVIEVLQKGYMLKDRILRPALVKVSE